MACVSVSQSGFYYIPFILYICPCVVVCVCVFVCACEHTLVHAYTMVRSEDTCGGHSFRFIM